MFLSEMKQIKNDGQGKKDGLKFHIRPFFAKDFFKNSIVHWMFIITIFLNVADWIVLYIFIKPVDLPIILHYNVYFGVDMIGDWWQVYFLPFIGAVFFIINALLAGFFYEKKERIASYIFLLAAFLIQAGIIIASASIIAINY